MGKSVSNPEHYTEDFEMSSPFIAQFAGETSGSLAGNAQVSAYWAGSTPEDPNLHFDLQSVLAACRAL